MQWVMDGIILVLRSTSWVKQGPSERERSMWSYNIAGHKEIRQRSISGGGGTLTDEQCICRVKVVKIFLKMGVLLKNWESFCVPREEGGYHFTTSSHAFQLIPLIRKGEEETIKSEISTFNVAVIFLWHNKAWGSSGNSAQVCYSWLENQMSPSLASVTSEVTLSKQEEFYQRDHNSTCSVQCHNLQPSCHDRVQCIGKCGLY